MVGSNIYDARELLQRYYRDARPVSLARRETVLKVLSAASQMDVKKAVATADGDVSKAIELLTVWESAGALEGPRHRAMRSSPEAYDVYGPPVVAYDVYGPGEAEGVSGAPVYAPGEGALSEARRALMLQALTRRLRELPWESDKPPAQEGHGSDADEGGALRARADEDRDRAPATASSVPRRGTKIATGLLFGVCVGLVLWLLIFMAADGDAVPLVAALAGAVLAVGIPPLVSAIRRHVSASDEPPQPNQAP